MFTSNDLGRKRIRASERFTVNPRIGLHASGQLKGHVTGFLFLEIGAGKYVHESDMPAHGGKFSNILCRQIAVHAGGQ